MQPKSFLVLLSALAICYFPSSAAALDEDEDEGRTDPSTLPELITDLRIYIEAIPKQGGPSDPDVSHIDALSSPCRFG